MYHYGKPEVEKPPLGGFSTRAVVDLPGLPAVDLPGLPVVGLPDLLAAQEAAGVAPLEVEVAGVPCLVT